jgi:hypothetical protein
MANPTITVSVSSTTITVGTSVTLSSSLSGGYQASGSISYDYVTGAVCPGSGISKVLGSVSVSNGIISSFAPQNLNSAGVYRIFASYSGDNNNVASVSSCQILTVRPTLSTPGSVTIGAGSKVQFPVNSTDPDGLQMITLTGSNLPSGASFTASQSTSFVSSMFTWTPPSNLPSGDYTVTFTAQAGGVSTSSQVVIHVNAIAKTAPLPILSYSIFGIVGFLVVLTAAILLRRFQNPKGKLKL